MPPDSRCRLILEVDLAADPISGVLRDGSGRARPFSGWMALTRTIELGLGAARDATSPDARAAPGLDAPDRPSVAG
jgi:hypothetical protein